MSAATTAPERADRFGEGGPPRSAAARVGRTLLGTAPIFLVLLALLVWITIENPNFTNPPVFLLFLRGAAPLMILAAGQLFVVLTGEFDLSVGALISLNVIVAGRLIDGEPERTWPVIALLVLIGVIVGVVNGLITTRLGVPSFITTLGTLLIIDGATKYWTGGSPRGELPDNFRMWGRQGIEDVPWLGLLPYSVIILVVVGIVATVILHATSYGKQVYATGGNDRAAHLSGVHVSAVRTVAFVLSALSAVIAGVLLGGFSGLSPDAGAGYEFQAIAAVVLGGALLGGGRGAMIPAMAGALTLQAIFTLLNLLGLPNSLDDVVQGTIIIAAVALAGLRQRFRR